MGIFLQFEYDEIKDREWVGEAKGLLQLFWEREWINEKEKVSKYYTVNGTKDWYMNIITGTSLTDMMESHSDFANEKTLLQENLSKLGIEVHRSPKYHSELAGEGIKYSWGFAKKYYRRLPLKLKRKMKLSGAASNLQCHERESQRRL